MVQSAKSPPPRSPYFRQKYIYIYYSLYSYRTIPDWVDCDCERWLFFFMGNRGLIQNREWVLVPLGYWGGLWFQRSPLWFVKSCFCFRGQSHDNLLRKSRKYRFSLGVPCSFYSARQWTNISTLVNVKPVGGEGRAVPTRITVISSHFPSSPSLASLDLICWIFSLFPQSVRRQPVEKYRTLRQVIASLQRTDSFH